MFGVSASGYAATRCAHTQLSQTLVHRSFAPDVLKIWRTVCSMYSICYARIVQILQNYLMQTPSQRRPIQKRRLALTHRAGWIAIRTDSVSVTRPKEAGPIDSATSLYIHVYTICNYACSMVGKWQSMTTSQVARLVSKFQNRSSRRLLAPALAVAWFLCRPWTGGRWML